MKPPTKLTHRSREARLAALMRLGKPDGRKLKLA